MNIERPYPNVRVAGDSDPALIFVHGFACSSADWDAQFAGLSSEFRCIALDLPGHGRSSPPATPTLSALGAAVSAVRQREAAGTSVLVGHSLGAKVIREAYWQDNAGIAGLILIDGAFYDGDGEAVQSRARAAIDEAGFAAYAGRHFADMFLPTSDPAMRDRILARARSLDPEFGRALYLEAVGWDPRRGRETLERVSVPTLVLQATDLDSHFKRRMLTRGMTTPFMRLATELAAQAEAEVIEGCGHFPMVEAPEAVNDAIRSFARRLRNRRGDRQG